MEKPDEYEKDAQGYETDFPPGVVIVRHWSSAREIVCGVSVTVLATVEIEKTEDKKKGSEKEIFFVNHDLETLFGPVEKRITCSKQYSYEGFAYT
jgi:hypothetical protein